MNAFEITIVGFLALVLATFLFQLLLIWFYDVVCIQFADFIAAVRAVRGK